MYVLGGGGPSKHVPGNTLPLISYNEVLCVCRREEPNKEPREGPERGGISFVPRMFHSPLRFSKTKTWF